MEFQVGDDYRIVTDDLNWIVQERHVMVAQKDTEKRKKGKEYETWKTLGYHGRLANALRALADTRVRNAEADNLRKALQAVETIAEEIAEAFDPIPTSVKDLIGESR